MLQLPRLFQLLQTAPVFSSRCFINSRTFPHSAAINKGMMLPLVTDRERHRDSTHALYSFYLPLLFIVRGPSCDSSWYTLEHVKGREAVSEEIGNFTTNSASGTRGKKPEYAKSLGVRVKRASQRARPGDRPMFVYRRKQLWSSRADERYSLCDQRPERARKKGTRGRR